MRQLLEVILGVHKSAALHGPLVMAGTECRRRSNDLVLNAVIILASAKIL